MRRQVNFYPAYDRTSEGYGRHHAEIGISLIGDAGAVTLNITTNWGLASFPNRLGDPHSTSRMNTTTYEPSTKLLFHSISPILEGDGDEYTGQDCTYTHTGRCFSDIGWSLGDEGFKILVESGEDAFYAWLQTHYDDMKKRADEWRSVGLRDAPWGPTKYNLLKDRIELWDDREDDTYRDDGDRERL